MAQTSIPAGRCCAAVGGLMHLLEAPATVQALARSSEGIGFWSLQLIRRLCATADSSSTPTHTNILSPPFPFTRNQTRAYRMAGKYGKTAAARFPRQLKFGLQELFSASNTAKKCYYFYLILIPLRLVWRYDSPSTDR